MSKWIPLNASMAGNRFNCFDWTLSLKHVLALPLTRLHFHTTEQHQNFPMQQNVGPYTCSRAEMSDQPSPQTSARRVFNRAEGASAASFKTEVQRRRRWVMLLFTEGESNRGGRLRVGHVHRERGSSEGFSISRSARRPRTESYVSTFRSFIPLFYVLELRLTSDWST